MKKNLIFLSLVISLYATSVQATSFKMIPDEKLNTNINNLQIVTTTIDQNTDNNTPEIEKTNKESNNKQNLELTNTEVNISKEKFELKTEPEKTDTNPNKLDITPNKNSDVNEEQVQYQIKPTLSFFEMEDTSSTTATTTMKEIQINFLQDISEQLAEKISQSDTHPGEIVNPIANRLNMITLAVHEENEKLTYKIKPTLSQVSLNEDEHQDKIDEVISLLPDKKIEFQLKKQKFIVDGNDSYDYAELIDKADNYFIGLDLQTSSSSKISHFKTKPKKDCLELHFGEKLQDKLELCSDLKIESTGTYLTDGANKFKLKSNPDLIFEGVKKSTDQNNTELIAGKLIIKEDKPTYEFNIQEKHKLFWIFPVDVRADLEINAEDDSLLDVHYNWLGFLFKDKDYALEFKFLPNLVFEYVEFEPQSVHTGDKIVFKGRILNTGSKYASASYTSEAGPSSIDLYFGDDINITSQDTGFSIYPGESVGFYLEWPALLCNVPINIFIDPANKIEELNENDNTWSYNVKCAPTNAPDLVADPITYSNNYKKIGVQNTIHLTFRNQGTQPAPEHTSFYYYDGLSSSIVVPTLAPGASWSTTRSVTPKNCDSVRVEVDTYNTVDEIDEGNNISYENYDISQNCHHRADLFVDHVWWKAGDYSFGDIHAGEQMWFEYTIKNDPLTFSNHDACLSGFKTALKLNGNTIATENLGWIGCVDDYAYNHPDYWKRRGHFTYTPQCNGEKLTIEVDPNNAISESQEWNNTWSLNIVCTAPPPIATPN